MHIHDDIVIDEAELEERFVRASGPGGQHVNKTSSAVQLRFDLSANTSLPDAVKTRLRTLAGSRLTKEDVVVLFCDDTRSQFRNRARIRQQLKMMITEALKTPRKRIKTRPPKAAVKRQQDIKRHRSTKKAMRQIPKAED